MGIMSTLFIFGPILYLWNLQFSDSRVSVMGYSVERYTCLAASLGSRLDGL